MVEMFDSSEPGNKMRDGQVTSPAVRLEEESGKELVATCHRGSPLSDGVGRICVVPLSGDNARTLRPDDWKTVVHFSGDFAPRFLSSKAQSTDDDIPKLISSAFSMNDPVTTMSPPSVHLHGAGRNTRPMPFTVQIIDDTTVLSSSDLSTNDPLTTMSSSFSTNDPLTTMSAPVMSTHTSGYNPGLYQTDLLPGDVSDTHPL
jgi:hypothetical protein